MAARRNKSQARRNHGNRAGLPGWAWLVLGIVLTLAAVLFAPRLLRSGDGDGFLRPQPNPQARPATSANDDADAIDTGRDDDAGTGSATADGKTPATDASKQTQYDFYTLLPGEEVAMSDAELAATEREEAARKTSATDDVKAAAEADAHPDATGTTVATPATPAAPATTTAPAGNDAPYILQAGAFGASGDAETVKAKIALLGLSARVESAQINGKTVYRVRMGPYGTASELAEAKRKLASGGLPAMAIKAK